MRGRVLLESLEGDVDRHVESRRPKRQHREPIGMGTGASGWLWTPPQPIRPKPFFSSRAPCGIERPDAPAETPLASDGISTTSQWTHECATGLRSTTSSANERVPAGGRFQSRGTETLRPPAAGMAYSVGMVAPSANAGEAATKLEAEPDSADLAGTPLPCIDESAHATTRPLRLSSMRAVRRRVSMVRICPLSATPRRPTPVRLEIAHSLGKESGDGVQA